jgi:ribulose kinase
MMKKVLSALTVAAALGGTAFMPAAASAQDRDHDGYRDDHRVYDRSHHDYHSWNGNEDRKYREYLETHHRHYTAYSRMNRTQQQAYWQWRHDHR